MKYKYVEILLVSGLLPLLFVLVEEALKETHSVTKNILKESKHRIVN